MPTDSCKTTFKSLGVPSEMIDQELQNPMKDRNPANP